MTAPVARFEILGVLGAGGCAVVALARDREDAESELVAIKVLRGLKQGNRAMLQRLRAEARMLAWLRHPDIVHVHRLLEKDGRPIVVMEYVRGASVSEQVRQLPFGLPPAIALEIARRAALALVAANATIGSDGVPMGIVHRDIKPANVLVSVDGDVKLVDFGIAVDSHGAQGGALIGTRGYAAPERCVDGFDTPAVDVYALGVTLFEMLTGRAMNPSMGSDTHDASVADLVTHIEPPGRTDVAELRELVARMCRCEPDERPAMPEVVALLNARIPSPVSLRAYAAAHVRALDEERSARMKYNAPPEPSLAFLKAAGPVENVIVPTLGPPRALALRPQRHVDVEPLLAAIAARPWWTRSASQRARVLGALLSLRGTRDPRVTIRAFELTLDSDRAIVEAAWDVLITTA